jgi:hypothetical protein
MESRREFRVALGRQLSGSEAFSCSALFAGL